MSPSIHSSFSNVHADQTYSIDQIITELQRMRDNRLKALSEEFERVQNGIANDEPLFPYNHSFQNLEETHNAYFIAKEMKRSGITNIKLNPAKDMNSQILAQADQLDIDPNIKHKFGVYTYKQKLKK